MTSPLVFLALALTRGLIATESNQAFKVSVGVDVGMCGQEHVCVALHIHIMNVRAICCAQVFRTSVMNPTCSSCDCFPCTCRVSGGARASRSGPSRPLEVCYCCTKSLTRPSGRAQSSRVLPSRSGAFLASVCETCWVHDQVGSLLRDLPRSSPAFSTASDGLHTLYELLRTELAVQLREARTQAGSQHVSTSAAWAGNTAASTSSAIEGPGGRSRSRSPRR